MNDLLTGRPARRRRDFDQHLGVICGNFKSPRRLQRTEAVRPPRCSRTARWRRSFTSSGTCCTTRLFACPWSSADAAVVVVAGPRQELLENEMQSLETFLGRGGRLLLLLDPDTARGFMPFVQQYGLELSEDVIIETNPLGRLVGGDYLVPVVMSYEAHAITRDFGNIMSIFPVVRSVQVSKELPEGITAQALASTSPESWAETDMQGLKEGRSAFDEASDRRGPVSLAAVANIAPKTLASQPDSPAGNAPEKPQNPAGGRLVVFGDSEFANNNFFASPGNSNLFLNTVSWLAEEEDLIAIRPRQGGKSGPVIVNAQQAPWLFWLPVVVLPLAVFTSGAVVFFRRRWQQ